ncbi:hypothetical protein ACRN97_01040 [Shewanella baltica]|uniref:hypothetical protein n=1 Tax=Shewanella baltica TaxID=62322 RepID=UPI00217F1E01|nr:hypothetical protein [Shewanella baltica]
MNISIYAAVEPSATSLWRVTGETMAINAARTQVFCFGIFVSKLTTHNEQL